MRHLTGARHLRACSATHTQARAQQNNGQDGVQKKCALLISTPVMHTTQPTYVLVLLIQVGYVGRSKQKPHREGYSWSGGSLPLPHNAIPGKPRNSGTPTNPKDTIYFQLQEFEEFRNPSFKCVALSLIESPFLMSLSKGSRSSSLRTTSAASFFCSVLFVQTPRPGPIIRPIQALSQVPKACSSNPYYTHSSH